MAAELLKLRAPRIRSGDAHNLQKLLKLVDNAIGDISPPISITLTEKKQLREPFCERKRSCLSRSYFSLRMNSPVLAFTSATNFASFRPLP